MTSPWWESDDALLEELGSAIRDRDEDSERPALLMTGYDLVNLEATIIEQTFDSLTASSVPTRSGADEPAQPGTASLRAMRFAGQGFAFDIELDGDRLVGHIEPVADGRVHLDTVWGDAQTDPDPDLGAFEFEIGHHASFRLRFVSNTGETIVTPWITR